MLNWLMKPTTDLPSRGAKRLSDAVSPMDQEGSPLRGFISGATESAGRMADDMTSPLSLALMAAGPLMRGLSSGSKAIGPSMELLQEAPAIKQMAPKVDDVDALIGDMYRNLAKVPNAGQRTMNSGISPSMLPPEMVQRGSESIYNTARAGDMMKGASSVENMAKGGNYGNPRIPMGGDINLAEMMAKVAKARGK